MTFQLEDRIFYEGNEYVLSGEPLAKLGTLPEFVGGFSANQRGYVAVWVVIADRLFLVSVQGDRMDSKAKGVQIVFPDAREPVFAKWYTGELRLNYGRVVEDWEFVRIYSHYIVLRVEDGVVIDVRRCSHESIA